MMNGLFIRTDHCYQKIDIASILYVKASGNYSKIVTTGKPWLTLASLRQIELCLPREDFCRIHRSFLVNTSRITAFDNHEVWLGDCRLPVGQTYVRPFFARMPIVIQQTEKKGTAPQRRRRKAGAEPVTTAPAGR